jgi:spore coat protein H
MNHGLTNGRAWALLAASSFCLAALGWTASPSPATNGRPSPAASAPGSDLFAAASPVRIRLQISSSALASLRREPRRHVDAVLREGDIIYPDVAVHLKGSIGSYRNVDDKPSLTITFDRYRPSQLFHGLSKIHLNNSVEDPSFLNERIGSEMFWRAGIPSPQVGWAVLELNGRRLGLYVLKEGFTASFLERSFGRPHGNLYEGSGSDVGLPMPADIETGSEDRALLDTAAALRELDPNRRWTRLGRTVDMDRFLSFMAMEMILGHRDGYCLARNNYRIYQDPARGQLVFLPHGMDQLFGRADATITPVFAGQVAAAVHDSVEGRNRYLERVGDLVTHVFKPDDLASLVDRWTAQIRPVLTRNEAKALAAAVEENKHRIAARQAFLVKRLAEPEPKPLAFEGGIARLTDWVATDIPKGGRLERTNTSNGTPVLMIQAGPNTMASWRCKVLLSKGRYRFEGVAVTRGVQAPTSGKNRGAGLRVSGIQQTEPYKLKGDGQATPLSVVFQIQDPRQEVEMICELRATAGLAWFVLDSLRLIPLPADP